MGQAINTLANYGMLGVNFSGGGGGGVGLGLGGGASAGGGAVASGLGCHGALTAHPADPAAAAWLNHQTVGAFSFPSFFSFFYFTAILYWVFTILG